MDAELQRALKTLGVSDMLQFGSSMSTHLPNGPPLTVRSPIDDSTLADLPTASVEEVAWKIRAAERAFPEWRDTPAPVRGEFVRRIGNVFRERREELATLIAWEAGKILPEARGEVQEVIDICDFALGLSRQLYGDHEGGQRTITRFAMLPRDDGGWIAVVSRHWNLDRTDPR